MQEYMYLIAGLILLIQGADWLLEGAASLAKKLKIHKLIVGLTIVAFGTSLPELFVTIAGSISGNPDIIFGNILGSNTANILLILGITALITPLAFKHSTIWKEIPFSFLSFIVLLILASNLISKYSALTTIDGIILLILFILFLAYTAEIIMKKGEGIEADEEIELAEPKFQNYFSMLGIILIGLIALYLGSEMTVDNAIITAQKLGISQFFISATIIAVGTSLPELFVSVRAAIKKEMDLAIGNIVGSNIFNTLFILGVAALIKPVIIANSIFIDIIICMIVTALLFAAMFIGQKHTLKRWQGTIFLICYILYILYLLQK